MRLLAMLRFARMLSATLMVLVLAAVAGHATAVRLAAGEAAMRVPFEDTYWKLVEFDGRPFEPGPGDTHVVFGSNGKFSGYAICNSIFSSYAKDGATVTVKPIGMTMRGCIKDEDNAREQALVKALRQMHGWKIEGDRLVLSDADGKAFATFAATAR